VAANVVIGHQQTRRARRLARVHQHPARACSTSSPASRWTAAASCAPSSGAGAAIGWPPPATRRWSGASSPTGSSAFGVFLALQPGDIFSGLWLALIGWFLSNAAEATAAQAGVERSLRGVRVRDAMDLDPPWVSPNEPVNELVNTRMLRGEDRSFLVRHDDGGLAGIVTLTDVRRLSREEWEGRA
jgi:CBS domain-containing protein